MKFQQYVSIIGAGPAGFALAADLLSHGKNVLLYSHPTHLRHANSVREKGCLQACGVMEGFADIPITTDMAEVVAFSQVIFVTVPSTGQETILQEMQDYDLSQHILIAVPGNLLSLVKDASMKFANILETNLSPYSCRMDEGQLLVLGRKKRISIAALNNTNLDPDFYDAIQDLFPGVRLRWCSSIVEVCLSNINGVFHPLMMLMNAGRIENTNGDFLLYHDGLTPSVAKAMLGVDKVRMDIGAALGLCLQSTIEVSNECYDQSFTSLVTLAQHSPPHNRLKAPSDFGNRNISEDVPDLLVPWCGLAELLGIDASPIAAVVVLAEMTTGERFMETGRTMRRLQLDTISRRELVARYSPPAPTTQYESRL
ncbi:hypothetical protein PG996_011997 [Apiospora saccharicola]|uniref:NAD/NADP octopine/nopaline dehydrogenase n=1 Tax=Apiospora saccharicola TaxID=335842 RepID=A0ABR1U1C0_9PEZI